MRIIVIILLCLCTVAAHAEGTEELEALVKYQQVDRTTSILRKYKVKNAAFYARLLNSTPMSEFERRLFTYKLVLETRGDANAVSSEGAVGPLQLHPIHFKEFKVTARQAAQPATNLRLCLRVYRMHLQESNGRVFGYKGAVWRYSGGSMSYVRKVYQMMHGA